MQEAAMFVELCEKPAADDGEGACYLTGEKYMVEAD